MGPVRTSLVVLMAIVIAGCGGRTGKPLPTPTPTIVLGPLPLSVPLPQGSAAPFAISGNDLAWAGVPKEDGACPRYHLYLANVRAFHPRSIWTAKGCDIISDVQISPRWLVWISGVPPGGSIWAMDFATGRHRVVAMQRYHPLNHPCLTLSCVPPVAMSLDGNMLVWSHSVFSGQGDLITSQIRERLLSSRRIRTLYATHTTCEMQIDPSVSGGRVVWLQARWPRDQALAGETPPNQCEGTLQTNVITKVFGGTARPLTGNGAAANPQTTGLYVMWQDLSRSVPTCITCAPLLLLDTRTGRRSQLDQAAGIAPGDVRMTPSLALWISESGGGIVVTQDLRTGARTSFGVAAEPGPASFPRYLGSGWARRITWEQDTVSPSGTKVRVEIRDVP